MTYCCAQKGHHQTLNLGDHFGKYKINRTLHCDAEKGSKGLLFMK
jgi:hypothetical protein